MDCPEAEEGRAYSISPTYAPRAQDRLQSGSCGYRSCLLDYIMGRRLPSEALSMLGSWPEGTSCRRTGRLKLKHEEKETWRGLDFFERTPGAPKEERLWTTSGTGGIRTSRSRPWGWAASPEPERPSPS